MSKKSMLQNSVTLVKYDRLKEKKNKTFAIVSLLLIVNFQYFVKHGHARIVVQTR